MVRWATSRALMIYKQWNAQLLTRLMEIIQCLGSSSNEGIAVEQLVPDWRSVEAERSDFRA